MKKLILIALIALISLVLISGCAEEPNGKASIIARWDVDQEGVPRTCGNFEIDPYEDCWNCPNDVRCAYGFACCNRQCKQIACMQDSDCDVAPYDEGYINNCIEGGSCDAECSHTPVEEAQHCLLPAGELGEDEFLEEFRPTNNGVNCDDPWACYDECAWIYECVPAEESGLGKDMCRLLMKMNLEGKVWCRPALANPPLCLE